MIRGPHWRLLRLAAEDAIVEERINADGIRALERWLAHAERETDAAASPDAVLSFFAASVSSQPIKKLVGALHAVDPEHPHLPVLSQAMELRHRAYRPAKAERARSRTPTVSVERHELPGHWLEAITAMKARERRGCAAPAPSIIATIEMKLRQLGHSARGAGLPAELTIPTLSAYVRAMIARGLASSTIGSTLGKIGTFAVYTRAPDDVVAAVAEEQRYHEREARRAGKEKERFLHQSGLTLDDVARKALEFYEKARVEANPAIRHMDLMRGALFAFVLCRSLRPHDIRNLMIGQHLQRDSEGWALYARTRKNRYKLVGRLWDICTPFLDGAILLGADDAFLWNMYRRAEGRPLLADRQGVALCDNWATEQSRQHLGTGIGILRTLWHDHCAAVGDARAVETALAICGQYDPRTTRHYRTSAGERNLVAQAQGLLAAIADGEAGRAG